MDALASQYPGRVRVDNIGQSYWKQMNQGGFDIKVMVINVVNEAAISPHNKADMVLVGGQHSRELPPPEVLMRFAQHWLVLIIAELLSKVMVLPKVALLNAVLALVWFYRLELNHKNHGYLLVRPMLGVALGYQSHYQPMAEVVR